MVRWGAGANDCDASMKLAREPDQYLRDAKAPRTAPHVTTEIQEPRSSCPQLYHLLPPVKTTTQNIPTQELYYRKPY